MERTYTPSTKYSDMDASPLTLDSGLSLPPMSPVWTNYINPDTLSCCCNLQFDIELADMEPVEPSHSEKTGLILRLKVKRQPSLVLKMNQKHKKVYKASSSFVTPRNKRF